MTALRIRPSTTRSVAALWAKSLLNAILFFALFLALLPWLAHLALPIALPVRGAASRAVGAVVFVAAVGLWVWCLDVFSRRGRGTPFPLDAPRHMVSTGPYAVIRNPIMAAEVAIAWAETLYFGTLGLLLYAGVATLLAHVMAVTIEEPELRERMGREYDEYCARVPRWFPRRGK